MEKDSKFASCPLPPKVEEEIYVFDVPAGPDRQLNGVKAVVKKIEDINSGPIALKFVTTDVCDDLSFSWEDLGVEQEDLKEQFGETRASATQNTVWEIK